MQPPRAVPVARQVAPPPSIVYVSAPPSSPAASPATASSAEQLVAVVRLSRWSFFWSYLFGLLLAPIGVGLLLWFRIWLARRSTVLTITTRRTIFEQGFWSITTAEVRHCDVRDLVVSQGLVGAWLNFGDLSISSAGQSGFEISVEGIARPEWIRNTIRQYQG